MIKLIKGDCLEVLKRATSESVDSIVTDPPYELGFMGKHWDNSGIAYNVDLWREALRVLKPGGHLLAFGGTRTYHRMASAIEDAGFEVRDMIEWVYGSGFPKSLNISKSIENKMLTGNASKNGFHKLEGERREGRIGMYDTVEEQGFRKVNPDQLGAFDLEPTTDEAKQWEGWGTALKPAHEPICMARKPLAEKTVAQNVLKYGTGGINIDESRVEFGDETDSRIGTDALAGGSKESMYGGYSDVKDKNIQMYKGNGRFPANLIHDNSEEVRECFPESNGQGKHKKAEYNANQPINLGGGQVNTSYEDKGNASRFFKSIIYQAKASKSERNKGCEELEPKEWIDGACVANRDIRPNEPSKNNHPTVKPIALMEYLIKMVTPPGGIVLDPFMGSGSTGVAAVKNYYHFIGIEREADYIKIAEARIK